MWYKESGLNFCSVGMVIDYAEKLANKGYSFVVENGKIYEEVEETENDLCE